MRDRQRANNTTACTSYFCSALQALYRQVSDEKAILEKDILTMKRTATPRCHCSTGYQLLQLLTDNTQSLQSVNVQCVLCAMYAHTPTQYRWLQYWSHTPSPHSTPTGLTGAAVPTTTVTVAVVVVTSGGLLRRASPATTWWMCCSLELQEWTSVTYERMTTFRQW